MFKKISKTCISWVLCCSILILPSYSAPENRSDSIETKNVKIIGDIIPGMESKAAVLMDASSGNFLMEKNSHEKLPIASITKIMTMLLVMEALDSGKIKYESMVPVSEHAYSMGGSQVFLEPGEEFTVEEMLKAVAIHSANDATVALAEFIEGSETTFVSKMNQKAKLLKMNDTNFLDSTGLTDEGHFSSAHDIAIMSRELFHKHPKIEEYTKIWIHNFGEGTRSPNEVQVMVNTNKLIKSYKGATGLKTGFTTLAGYCLSAVATRNNVTLVSVAMGLPNDEKRFIESKKILDYGFLNYEIETIAQKGTQVGAAKVKRGIGWEVPGIIGSQFQALVKRNEKDKVIRKVTFKEDLIAPIEKGSVIGEVSYHVGEREITKMPIVAKETMEKASWMRLFWRMVLGWFGIQY